MAKPEKFGHLHLVYHFKVPLIVKPAIGLFIPMPILRQNFTTKLIFIHLTI